MAVYDPPFLEQSTQLVADWLNCLGHFDPNSATHIDECYEEERHATRNSNRTKVEWIVTSDDFLSWLDSDESMFLEIQSEEEEYRLHNAVTLTSAILANLTSRFVVWPTMSVFCSLRANANANEPGPHGILKCLNSQLLMFVCEKCPTFDLRFLEEVDMFDLQSSVPGMLELFDRLLDAFLEGTKVFIILDSWFRAQGDMI